MAPSKRTTTKVKALKSKKLDSKQASQVRGGMAATKKKFKW